MRGSTVLRARLDEPEKNWKVSKTNAHERHFRDDCMDACEDAICNTATKDAPWYVIPADNKWFTRTAVAEAVIDVLSSLALHFPKVSSAQRREPAEVRETLLSPE